MIIWIVLALAIIIILTTTIMSIRAIFVEKAEMKKHAHKKNRPAEKPARKKRKLDIIENDEDEDDEDDVKVEEPRQRKRREISPRRWKIVLEDMSTDETQSFIFYNSVGIGRTTQEVSFEKFMSIPDDKRISKVHCSITMIDDGLYIKDEGSKNHTYLNGKKIQKPVLLQKEDVISIGETDIEVVKIFREAEKK